MKRFLFITVGALFAIMALLSRPVQANMPEVNGVIVTQNDTDHRIWVTIYDVGKTQHLDYGWVGPHDHRYWSNCCYAAGSYYHVRAEVKKAGDNRPNPETVYDTTMQVSPRLCVFKNADGSLGNIHGYARVLLKQGSNNFYWVRDDLIQKNIYGKDVCVYMY